MKLFYLLFFLFTGFSHIYSQSTIVNGFSANDVLNRVSEKLNSLKNISYDYKRKLHYYSENYHHEMTATVYLDLTSTDTLIGFKYLVEDSVMKQIFNGTEKFELNKESKTINVSEQPKARVFHSLSFLYNSIITFKNAIPLILSNDSISKTIAETTDSHNMPCYSITIVLHKAVIDYVGRSFNALTTERDVTYTILIDKNSYLPGKMIQTSSANNDSTETDFSNIIINKTEPSELSWFYSTYTNVYKPAQQKETPQLLSIGTYAPQWTLPLYNKDEVVILNDLKGKVILIDFWIKNCSPCIESVFHLNGLHEKFKDKNFELLSINSYDTNEEVKWFCNKHKSSYKVLMNGKEIAAKYGVTGFPAFFIISKEGKILYSAMGFSLPEKSTIERVIESAL